MSAIFCCSSSRSSMMNSLPDRHDLLAELHWIEGLGDHRDRTQLAKARNFGRHGLRSDEYYRDVCEARIRTHTLQRRRTVGTGHHHVEEHQIWRYVRQPLQGPLA